MLYTIQAGLRGSDAFWQKFGIIIYYSRCQTRKFKLICVTQADCRLILMNASHVLSKAVNLNWTPRAFHQLLPAKLCCCQHMSHPPTVPATQGSWLTVLLLGYFLPSSPPSPPVSLRFYHITNCLSDEWLFISLSKPLQYWLYLGLLIRISRHRQLPNPIHWNVFKCWETAVN